LAGRTDDSGTKETTMFSDKELAYLGSQRLARLATVSASGQADADAVGFEFDGERFYVGGRALPTTRKYRNVAGGNAKVSLIVDDLESVNPWRPRGIKVHGVAVIVDHDGMFGAQEYLAIAPTVTWSWGLGERVFKGDTFAPRKTVWTSEQ
jgi:pyridoxamine 5'-phosphate oxidase family protein